MRKAIHTREYKALTKWLKERRLEAGMTIRQVADKLGVHHSVVGKIETCERRLDLVEYMDYCKAIKVNPTEGLRAMLRKA